VPKGETWRDAQRRRSLPPPTC